ncbi:MAG: magnesium transporter [Chloroflexota bacterium]|nr:MAG: magnesium transporter [Anaerolineaceae bacterium 4572_5.2]RLD05692.1 MAG: magnesium transporter [Chloroflexota bacterium]
MSEKTLPRQHHSATELESLLKEGKYPQAAKTFLHLHPADQAKYFKDLDSKAQLCLLKPLTTEEAADLFDELSDEETVEIARELSLPYLADILDDMDPDEAADLLGDLSDAKAQRALSLMEETSDVLPLLPYPDETAGGRMTTEYIKLYQNTLTEKAIRYLRESAPPTDIPYYLFVTNENGKLVGVTGLRELICGNPQAPISELMKTDVISITADSDQEQAARLMQHYDLSALPVVDTNNNLLGVISHDDILDVIEDEATEDIYRMANVSDNALEPDSKLSQQLRGRLPWLLLNTLTALFGSWVISNFEDLFIQVAVLAFFQSIVAAQGGNAASQNVAMIVRGLALGEVNTKKIWSVLFRQLAVSASLGFIIGGLVGTGVGVWQGNPYLGLVLGLALLGNMLVAGVVGTLAPVALQLVGQDPALASSVLVTALTDSLGFLIFLSLAKTFLPFIQQYI